MAAPDRWEELCYFPAPRGQWPETSEGFFLGELTNRVDVADYDRKRLRRVYVEIAAEFIRLYYGVVRPHPPKKWFDVHFRVEPSADRKRFYFCYVYAERENGPEYAYPLWYWTPSNMPSWLYQRE